MKFWKEHTVLRIVLMIAFFAIGTVLLIWGWTMTGQMKGLAIMLVGVVFLLQTLFLYNQAYAD